MPHILCQFDRKLFVWMVDFEGIDCLKCLMWVRQVALKPKSQNTDTEAQMSSSTGVFLVVFFDCPFWLESYLYLMTVEIYFLSFYQKTYMYIYIYLHIIFCLLRNSCFVSQYLNCTMWISHFYRLQFKGPYYLNFRSWVWIPGSSGEIW